MKILLLGEYSGLHNNLKAGLQELGHEVTLAASGDGFKNFPADIKFDSQKKGILGKLERNLSYFLHLNKMVGYDVVQVINPIVFNPKFGINKFLLNYIIKNNNIVSLLGAGCDAFYWQKARYELEYGPFDDNLKYDYKSITNPYYDGDDALNWNTMLANKVNHIIPIMYEYEVGYKNFANLRKCIPIPMDINKIEYQPNVLDETLKVFHGLNRYGFKGTRIVEQAFLNLKHNKSLDLRIEGNMPIDEYLQVMKRTNIIVDQVYSYSAGMNAIYALAMGKIVLGGAEPESLKALGFTNTPIFNIKPNAESIVQTIEYLLDHRFDIPEKSFEARNFVTNNHNYINVAESFINTWLGKF